MRAKGVGDCAFSRRLEERKLSLVEKGESCKFVSGASVFCGDRRGGCLRENCISCFK